MLIDFACALISAECLIERNAWLNLSLNAAVTEMITKLIVKLITS
jgi:hypothetical protein